MIRKILRFIILRKYRFLLIMPDLIAINMAVYISNFLLGRPQPLNSFYLISTIMWLIIASLFLLYSTFRYSIRWIASAIIAWWVFLNLAVLYAEGLIASKSALVLMLPLTTLSILGHRLILRHVKINKQKKGEVRALILGLGEKAKEIAKQLEGNKTLNYKILGFISSGHQNKEDITVSTESILGNIEELYAIAKRKRINEVIIALPSFMPFLHKSIEKLIEEYSDMGINFTVIPDLYDALIGRLKMERIIGYPLLNLSGEMYNRRYLVLKRLIDITASSLGLVFLSPVMLLIAGLLKFYEKGPVFYRQERVGESARPFILYKFCSMVPDAERDTGPVWAEEDDRRITRFGSFLRRNSLDELPQLWNVLKGDMSFVGPRPERPHFVNNHKELQGRRLNVKPGITGLAQINGRYNLSARQKAKYDYLYLKNYSFRLDMMILFKTVDTVLSRRGAR